MPEIFVDNAEIAVADQWVETQRLALARSRAMLAVLTPSYFQSSWCMAEFETFVRRSYIVNKVLLVSIRYSQISSWPDIALNHPTFNFTEYAIAGKGLKTASRHGRFPESVRQVADRLVDGLRATTAPDPRWPVTEPRDTGIGSNDAKPTLE